MTFLKVIHRELFIVRKKFENNMILFSEKPKVNVI